VPAAVARRNNELNLATRTNTKPETDRSPPPAPPAADDDDDESWQSPPYSPSAIWRRIDSTCARASISRARSSRHSARIVAVAVVAVVAVVVVAVVVVIAVTIDPSLGEASGRKTESDDNDDDDGDERRAPAAPVKWTEQGIHRKK
jgi:hypothetical protein